MAVAGGPPAGSLVPPPDLRCPAWIVSPARCAHGGMGMVCSWVVLSPASATHAAAADFCVTGDRTGRTVAAAVGVREDWGDTDWSADAVPLFRIPDDAGGYTAPERARIVAEERLDVLEQTGLLGDWDVLRVGRLHGEVVLYFHDPGHVAALRPAGTEGPFGPHGGRGDGAPVRRVAGGRRAEVAVGVQAVEREAGQSEVRCQVGAACALPELQRRMAFRAPAELRPGQPSRARHGPVGRPWWRRLAGNLDDQQGVRI